jgi:hypothetical protein
MLTDVEKARLTVMQARRQECEEWQIVAKAVEKSIQTPQSRKEVRELAAVALWLLLILGMAVGFPVLLWVGR